MDKILNQNDSTDAVHAVLLVEDSYIDVLEVTRHLKKCFNHSIALCHAFSMQEAKAIIAENPTLFDAAILDLGLPDTLGGIETFKEFRMENPDLPTIVLTGDSHPDLPHALMREGANDFFIKGHLLDGARQLSSALSKAVVDHQHSRDIAERISLFLHTQEIASRQVH